jgi:hypothetical protein
MTPPEPKGQYKINLLRLATFRDRSIDNSCDTKVYHENVFRSEINI